MTKPITIAPIEILHEGRHVVLKSAGGWEYAERRQVSGCVGILAVTAENKLLLVEQFRPPVQCNVIELPAGLAGDIAGTEDEPLAVAAKRELLEETGYAAGRMYFLCEGPVSAGLSTEIISFFHAQDLHKVHGGGGDHSEDIRVHEVPLDDLQSWLAQRRDEGCLIDLKIFTALHFLPHSPPDSR